MRYFIIAGVLVFMLHFGLTIIEKEECKKWQDLDDYFLNWQVEQCRALSIPIGNQMAKNE